jgi:hypothetical protein
MYAALSPEMSLAMFAIAAVASFFIGNAMNSLLGAMGFGVLGNMVILFVSYLLGRTLIMRLPYRTLPPEFHIPTAIGFAFAVLLLLVVLKRVMQKV